MLTFERIFVPVDFSTSSRVALKLAQQFNAHEIHTAHTIEPWQPYTREVLFPYAALGEDEVEFEHELRQRALAHLRQHYQLDQCDRCQPPQVLVGPAHEHLPQAMQRTNANVIVMGAFGQHGARPDTLGTTASMMVRHTIEPALIVRHYDPNPKIKHILCSIDLSIQSSRVVEAALSLACAMDATLETVYVLPDPLQHDTNNILNSQIKFNRKALLDRSKDKLEALFERARQNIDVPFPLEQQVQALWAKRSILFGDPSKEIIKRADATDADVIVVGSRNIQNTAGPLLGQVCWSITRRSTSHVMVVPVEQASQLLEENN